MSDLSKLELDLFAANGCQVPGCAHKDHDQMFIVQRCHPGAKRDVIYTQGSGVLVVACQQCGSDIVRIKVAES